MNIFNMRFSLTFSLAFLSLLVSCSKHNSNGSTGTISTGTAPPVTMKLNLATSFPNEEIIFSDSGGKVLLDTMSPYPNPLVASLRTSQTLIDLTTIVYDTPEARYEVSTIKAINPSLWGAVDPNIYYSNSSYPNLSATNATVHYINTPPYISNGQFLIDDYVSQFNFTSGTPSYGYLDVTYSSYNPANYVYLIFPYSGLYNFHIPPQGTADTVDLSTMDTAVTINYVKPPGYSVTYTYLYGIMDTTDLTRTLALYRDFSGINIPDVEYPKKYVQKFEFNMNISIDNTHSDNYYSYGDTIPSTLYWPSDIDYTLPSNQFTAFQVAFAPTVHPAEYGIAWSKNNLLYSIIAPSDSTTLNPQDMLSSLKGAKLLQGQSLTGLRLGSFVFETPGTLSYADYYSAVYSPAQDKSKHISSMMSYSIYY